MIELGLQRVTRLLARTALPWRAIHVAGTNGKGSICAYISCMLEAYNRSEYREMTNQPPLKHARFTSPHLIDRWDCITIDQETVPFCLFDEVERAVLARNAAEKIQASEFELLTATAFEIFTREHVDVGVVEVGMGGRLDATNVIGQEFEGVLPKGMTKETFRPMPLVTAISKIGMDHQAFLGNTLEDIAREKAGISKHLVPIVWDSSNSEEVQEVFRKIEFRGGAWDLVLAEFADVYNGPLDAPKIIAQWLAESQTSLAGHTRQNAGVAFVAAFIALRDLRRISWIKDPSEAPTQAAKLMVDLVETMFAMPSQTVFPGRQQRLSIKSLTGRKDAVLLDGAHNADSAKVLAEAVEKLREPRQFSDIWAPVTWVVATSDSKPVTDILKHLLKREDRLVAVEFGPVDGMPWVKARKAEEILQAVEVECHLERHNLYNYGTGILIALEKATELAATGPLVIAGSLYLVSDILRLLRSHEDREGKGSG